MFFTKKINKFCLGGGGVLHEETLCNFRIIFQFQKEHYFPLYDK